MPGDHADNVLPHFIHVMLHTIRNFIHGACLCPMTGVLPIAKYSSGSELNVFWEYNFMNDRTFEEQFGLTEDEVFI